MLRRYSQILFWSLFLIIAYRIGFRTPLNPLVFAIEAVVIVLSLGFLIWKIILALNNKIKLSYYELYLCFLLIFPFWSALAAYSEWEQPLYYGIGTQRSFFLFTTGFWLLHKLKKGDVTLDIIRKSYLTVAWISLSCFLITGFFINPAEYLETDFVGYNELKGGYIFKFVITFLTFGFLYYCIKFFKTYNFKWIFYAIILFSYIFFVRQDRSLILIALGTVGLYFIQNELRKNFIRNILMILLVAVSTVTVLMTTGTDYLATFAVKYDNILRTLEGNWTSESSTNMRRIEAIKVMPYIAENPILGNGELSLKYRNGFERVFGYLYPTDIGIIGEIFLYGFLGVILLNSQFLIGWYYSMKAKIFNHDPFFLSCKYSLFTFFMDSLTSGQTIYYSANSLIVITIIYFYSKQGREQKLLSLPAKS